MQRGRAVKKDVLNGFDEVMMAASNFCRSLPDASKLLWKNHADYSNVGGGIAVR